jgi:hypothetical protein
LAGLDEAVKSWREMESRADGLEYLFLDEIQTPRNCGGLIFLDRFSVLILVALHTV